MATASVYNHTVKRFLTGENAVGDTYKVVLLSAAASFTATDTTLAQVTDDGDWEIFGNGWSESGHAITGLTGAVTNTNDGKVSATDLQVPIIGGDLGPFSAYVIYNDTDTDDPPVAYIELTAAKTVENGYIAHFPWVDGVLFSGT
jgi:hypothetical protein